MLSINISGGPWVTIVSRALFVVVTEEDELQGPAVH